MGYPMCHSKHNGWTMLVVSEISMWLSFLNTCYTAVWLRIFINGSIIIMTHSNSLKQECYSWIVKRVLFLYF